MPFGGTNTTDFYIVDTITRKIKRGRDMVFPTASHARSASGILNDRLYVAGGVKEGHTFRDEDSAEWTASAQCYDISSNTWRSICPMPFQLLPQMFCGAYGMFVVTGQKNDDGDTLDGLCYYLCYSLESDAWMVHDHTEFAQKLELLQEEVRQELREEETSSDDVDDSGNSGDEEEEEKKEDDSCGGDDAFEKRLKARIKEIAGEDDGLLATETYFVGMFFFFLDVTEKEEESYKWKDMGDAGRLSQDQRMTEFHSDLISLLPREMLPSVSMINDRNGKELKFKAWFKIIQYTGIKTSHPSNWYDLPLLFYPLCGDFSMGLPEFKRSGCMAFDFVVVYY